MADEQAPLTPAQVAKAADAARKNARLRNALKANMARRKSQARARAGGDLSNTQTGSAPDAPHKEP